MKDWEKATEKFLLKWKDKKEVIGALVCGSYVTGRPTEHSDIDLHIILDNNCNWRQRGNEIIDGFLIEYFVNPPKQNIKYFESDYNLNRKVDCHMFITGKILFDKTGDVKKLISKAKTFENKKFKKLDAISIEINKYALWDNQDNLEEVYDRAKEDFYFVYYNHLNEILRTYSKYIGYALIPTNRVRRFLTDKKDIDKYRLDDFPDKKFIEMFILALEYKGKKELLTESKIITKYVLKQMGGLTLDGWKIKSPVEK